MQRIPQIFFQIKHHGKEVWYLHAYSNNEDKLLEFTVNVDLKCCWWTDSLVGNILI